MKERKKLKRLKAILDLAKNILNILLGISLLIFDIAVSFIIVCIFGALLGAIGVGIGIPLGFLVMVILIGIQVKILKKLGIVKEKSKKKAQ